MMVSTETKPKDDKAQVDQTDAKDLPNETISTPTTIKVQVGGMKEVSPTGSTEGTEVAQVVEEDAPKPDSAPVESIPSKEIDKEEVPSKDFEDIESGDTIADPDEEVKKAEEDLAKDEAMQKMVDSKQFYLPINAIEQRRTQRFIALGVVFSIILALAWLDISLDAGLINLGGIKSVTHFFSS